MPCAWEILGGYYIEALEGVDDPSILEDVLAKIMKLHGGKLGEHGWGITIDCDQSGCKPLEMEESTGEIRCGASCKHPMRSGTFTEFTRQKTG